MSSSQMQGNQSSSMTPQGEKYYVWHKFSIKTNSAGIGIPTIIDDEVGPGGDSQNQCSRGKHHILSHFDGLMQKRYNSIAFTLELCPENSDACIIIKSPRSGVTLCFQFISASAAVKTFPSHVKTIWAKPLIFGTKNIWVWGNVLDDLSLTLTQGHGCGID